MKPSDAFGREIAAIRELAGRLARRVTLMEVCGTHTVAICKSGLRDQVGDRVRLISGPGCPVCVSTQGYIDACVELAGVLSDRAASREALTAAADLFARGGSCARAIDIARRVVREWPEDPAAARMLHDLAKWEAKLGLTGKALG